MEKTRRQHQSSKRRVYDDGDKQAHKSRHDLQPSQPHISRPHSQARIDRPDPEYQSKPTNPNDYVASWLRDAFPHRHHPPESVKNPEYAVVKESKGRKRPRPLPESSESPGEDHIPKKTAFEKRPRHKTHKDKYDYKDGPGRRRKPPKEQAPVESGKRRRHEQDHPAPLPIKKGNNHGKHIKTGSQQVRESYQVQAETSPDLEQITARPRRSRNKQDNSARFDKDLKEISNFFNQKTDEDRPKIALRHQSRTVDEDDELSEPSRSRSSSLGEDEVQRRRPWYSDGSGGETQPKKTPSTRKSIDNLTWSTSQDPRTSLTDHRNYPESENDRLGRVRPEMKAVSVPSRRGEQELKFSKSQERRQRDVLAEDYRGKSRQIPAPPSPIAYRRGKENIPPRTYGGRDQYRQRHRLDDDHRQFPEDHATSDWHHRSYVDLDSRPDEWHPMPPRTQTLLHDGFEQTRFPPERRSFSYEPRLSNLDLGYFPSRTHAGFGPGVEGGYSLSVFGAYDAPRYSTDRNLTAPGAYGHRTLEPSIGVSSMDIQSNLHAPREAGYYPGVDYGPRPSNPIFPHYRSADLSELPRKQLKRLKRENYIERLEQETLGALEPHTGTNFLDTNDQMPADVSIQPYRLSSRSDLDEHSGNLEFVGSSMEQTSPKDVSLPLLSAALLTPTHGFAPLTPPALPALQAPNSQDGGRLSTIWERQSET